MQASDPRSVGAVTVRTCDGVPVKGTYRAGDGTLAFVVVHGFTQSGRDRGVKVIITALQPDPVFAIDLRGHGRSGGSCTLGAEETRDVDAAVTYLRSLGHTNVVTVGASLGGASVLRHAAVGANRPDACVAISSPSRWWIRETAAMRRVHWVIERPLGRLAGRLLGVRLAPRWRVTPAAPVEVVHRIAPTPLLLVHGTADGYFGPDHGEALHRAAGHGDLWVEEGLGHGAGGSTPELVGRIRAWSHGVCTAGARPWTTT